MEPNLLCSRFQKLYMDVHRRVEESVSVVSKHHPEAHAWPRTRAAAQA